MSFRPPAPGVFLHPGDFHFGHKPRHIGTLLGSCVAVTVWHPQERLGGMCHILLPCRQRRVEGALDCRYADEAVERFHKEVAARDIHPQACQTKLFGGGNMFLNAVAGNMDVGRRNISATRSALEAYGFRVMAEHVGGSHRRRLYFDLATGHVWMVLPDGEKIQAP